MPNSSIKNEKMYEDLRSKGTRRRKRRASPTRRLPEANPQWDARGVLPGRMTTGPSRS